MQLSDVLQAISFWNVVRSNAANAEEIISKGNYFEIGRSSMFNYWNQMNPKPEFIHAYLGVQNDQLVFFLIDDISDKADPPTMNNIYPSIWSETLPISQSIPRFENTDPTGHINILTGLERFFRWHLQKKSWLQDYADRQYHSPDLGEGIFQVFNIPMSDLEDIFNATLPGGGQNHNAIVMLGLRDNDGEHITELVLWGDTFENVEELADVSLPVPPFKPSQTSDYQLLHLAGAAPW